MAETVLLGNNTYSTEYCITRTRLLTQVASTVSSTGHADKARALSPPDYCLLTEQLLSLHATVVLTTLWSHDSVSTGESFLAWASGSNPLPLSRSPHGTVDRLARFLVRHYPFLSCRKVVLHQLNLSNASFQAALARKKCLTAIVVRNHKWRIITA